MSTIMNGLVYALGMISFSILFVFLFYYISSHLSVKNLKIEKRVICVIMFVSIILFIREITSTYPILFFGYGLFMANMIILYFFCDHIEPIAKRNEAKKKTLDFLLSKLKADKKITLTVDANYVPCDFVSRSILPSITNRINILFYMELIDFDTKEVKLVSTDEEGNIIYSKDFTLNEKTITYLNKQFDFLQI